MRRGFPFIYLLIIVCLAVLAVSAACKHKPEKYSTSVSFSMGTVVELTIPEKNKELLPEVEERLNLLSDVISSDCLKISSSPDPVEINEITYRLLQREHKYRDISGGRFNSAVHTIASGYGFPEGPFQVPSSEKLEEAKTLLRTQRVTISEDNSTGKYYADGNGLKIYLGAFAKGWIVDEVSAYLKNKGINTFIINAGGDLFAGGMKTAGKPWRMGITDPDKQKPYLTVVNLTDKGLATSGNYERFFLTDDGRRISHIFNGISGEPAAGYKSLSVIADTAELADAYSTIYYLMPDKDIDALCGQNGTAVLTVTTDGKEHRHCGWEKYETPGGETK